MEVKGSDPKTQNVSAVLADNFLGKYHVALGLVHYLALAVNYPAVGADRLVRSLACGRNRGEQGALEPASVLVAALEVEVSRPGKLGTLLEYCRMRTAGIEPYVEDVHFLAELTAAALALYISRDKLGRILGVPGIGAFLAEHVGYRLDGLVVYDDLSAVLTVEDWYRNAPAALTGNAPVASHVYHVLDALLAPLGNPLNFLDGLDGLGLEHIHVAEPLVCCAVDYRLVAAPAVRIRVDDLLHREQGVVVLKALCYRLVGVSGLETCKVACFLGQHALCVNGNDDFEHSLVLVADLKVLQTEAGSGMNAACTTVEGYMVADDYRRLSAHEWVICLDKLQVRTEEVSDGGVLLDSDGFHNGGNKLGRHQQVLTV